MNVRAAGEKDLESVLALYAHLFPEESYDDARAYREEWVRMMELADFHTVLLAEEEGAAVSSCCLTVVPNLTRRCRPYAIIENMITRTGCRRKGYGSAVMRRAIGIARERNCYKIMLLSGRDREQAHAFYAALGFDASGKKGFQMRFP